MRKITAVLLAGAVALAPIVAFASESVTHTFTVSVAVLLQDLSLATPNYVPTSASYPGVNISAIGVVANEPFTGTMSLDATSAANFSVSGCPTACELVTVGSPPAGVYTVSITATQP